MERMQEASANGVSEILRPDGRLSLERQSGKGQECSQLLRVPIYGDEAISEGQGFDAPRLVGAGNDERCG